MTSYYLLESAKPAYDDLGRPQIPFNQKLGTKEEAGWFCSRDQISLCKGGSSAVHKPGAAWYEQCPICGAVADAPNSPVKWAHSFTWASEGGAEVAPSSSGILGRLSEQIFKAEAHGPGYQPVIDDSGQLFTIDEFLETAAGCEIRFNEPVFS